MADPFSADPGAKLFRTGDRARLLADGNIEYRGRNDDLVKIEGFPVEISELESALSEIQPVKHCAVTVGNDQRGARFLVAYVELDGGHYTPDYQRHALATIESEAPGLPRLGCDDRAATRAL